MKEINLIVVTNIVRRNLIEVSYLLRKIKSKSGEQQRWKVVNFFNWYNSRFYPNVMHHHDNEEHMSFPFFKTKMPLPDRTSSDHEILIALMNAIKDMQIIFVEEATIKNDHRFHDLVKQLVHKWDELRDHTLPHLAEEEAISLDFPKYMTEEEYKGNVNEIIKAQTISALAKELPGIIIAMKKWADDEVLDNFLKKLPTPVKLMNDTYWTANFIKYECEALKSLASDKEVIIGPEPEFVPPATL